MKQRILMTCIYFADVNITKESFILEQYFISPMQPETQLFVLVVLVGI